MLLILVTQMTSRKIRLENGPIVVHTLYPFVLAFLKMDTLMSRSVHLEHLGAMYTTFEDCIVYILQTAPADVS